MKQKKILFVVPYPVGESPSQRFRFEQYFQILKDHGFEFNIQSFLNSDNWRVFYEKGQLTRKLLALLNGILKRLLLLFSVPSYNFIFIHREAAPIGPPVFEWVISKVLRKKIIYDFDDAIWMTENTNESTIAKIIRWRGKVSSICKWSHRVSCGNHYLQEFAVQFNSQVVYNPTTIDTEKHHNPDLFNKPEKGNNITIGWTGSHSTLKYLSELESVLEKIEHNFSTVAFIVIANKKPDLKLASLQFIQWNEGTEISDLLKIDIGIMPLPDDEWSKGKCGFKGLQYMALEIPSVASPVGVNPNIIQHGINGYLCNNHSEWFSTLASLISDKELRDRIGKEGRKTVIENYSVISNSAGFLTLFS